MKKRIYFFYSAMSMLAVILLTSASHVMAAATLPFNIVNQSGFDIILNETKPASQWQQHAKKLGNNLGFQPQAEAGKFTYTIDVYNPSQTRCIYKICVNQGDCNEKVTTTLETGPIETCTISNGRDIIIKPPSKS